MFRFGLLCGALAALPQCLMLRRVLPFAACWLAVSVSTWAIAFFIIGKFIVPLYLFVGLIWQLLTQSVGSF